MGVFGHKQSCSVMVQTMILWSITQVDHKGSLTPRVPAMTLNEVDFQKASMMAAHSCGEMIYNYTSERSPAGTLAKRVYCHHHHHDWKLVQSAIHHWGFMP
jgi:hypothetical protein